MAGPNAAQNVTVVDVLPAELQVPQSVTFSTSGLTNPACQLFGVFVLCTADQLVGGGVWLVEIPFVAPLTAAPGLIVNSANVTSGDFPRAQRVCSILTCRRAGTPDLDSANNVDTLTTRLLEVADVFVTWTNASGTVISGGTPLLLALQAGNKGLSSAANIVLQGSTSFPSSFSFQ